MSIFCSSHKRSTLGRLALYFSTIIYCANGMLVAAYANAAPELPRQATEAAQQTQSIVQLGRYYEQAPAEDREVVLEQLVTLALQRQQLLNELVEANPGAVLRLTLPARIRSNFPADVQALIEQRRTVRGRLAVRYEDSDQFARLLYVLETETQKIALHFDKNPPRLQSGAKVQVSGIDVGGSMAVESGETNVLMLAAGAGEDGGSNGGTPAPLPNSLGDQRTLVMLVNFQDMPDEQPWAVTDVHDAFFGEVNDFVQENSYGQASLSGDVFGWFTMPLDSSSCSEMNIEAAARAAAEAAGAVLSDYLHHVYVFPKTSSCFYSGSAMVGGTPSRIWINGDLRLKILGHELGHGLGLYHGHGWVCEGEIEGTSCEHLEYGDGLDIMGWSDAAHFSAFNKERLSWLNTADTPPIGTVSQNGTFVLEPYAAPGANPKALKLYKGIDPNTGRGVWYYLEYRQAIGFDSEIATSMMDASNILNGVVLRTASPDQSGNTGYLLDMTPETYQFYPRDPALTVGRTYVDDAAGVVVTTLWADANGAGVDISLDAQACAPANPGLVLSPVESQWLGAGTPASYTLTVSNNDNSACPSSNVILSASIPSGWSASFGDASLPLAPGDSGMTTMTVTSAVNTADGFYEILVTATSGPFNSSGSVTYVVDSGGGTNTAPVANDDESIMTEVAPVSIDVLANDWDADNDAISIESLSNGAKGVARLESDGTVTYTPGRAFKNRDSFSYTISDGNASSAATVFIRKDRNRNNR